MQVPSLFIPAPALPDNTAKAALQTETGNDFSGILSTILVGMNPLLTDQPLSVPGELPGELPLSGPAAKEDQETGENDAAALLGLMNLLETVQLSGTDSVVSSAPNNTNAEAPQPGPSAAIAAGQRALIQIQEIPAGEQAKPGQSQTPLAQTTAALDTMPDSILDPNPVQEVKQQADLHPSLEKANPKTGKEFEIKEAARDLPIKPVQGETLAKGMQEQRQETQTFSPSGQGIQGAASDLKFFSLQSKGLEPSSPLSFNQVADQIVQSGKLKVLGQKSELEIRLKPEHLGKLQVRMTLEDGVVAVRFLVENHQVGRLLDANVSNLKQLIQDQGLKFGQVEVEVGDQGAFSRQQEQGWQEKRPLVRSLQSLGNNEPELNSLIDHGRGSLGGVDYHA